jgi:DNA-binding PadR family transcriptional regulator
LGELVAMGWLRELVSASGERRTRKGAHRAAVQVYAITSSGIAELHRVTGNGRLPGQRADHDTKV